MQWKLGCTLYSLSGILPTCFHQVVEHSTYDHFRTSFPIPVSIKMNMLLYAPGLLLCLLMGQGIGGTVLCLLICAAVQVAVGFPFLTSYPLEYLTRSFEFSRVFKYQWTVNFKFLSEEIFLSKYLSIALLLLTVIG